MSSSSGQLVGEVTRYYPFGDYRSGGPNAITDRGFTGQKENMELGLYYYNARYYVPYLNRFISADTIVPDPANPQSFNRYSYTLNNPLKYTDPTGHLSEDEIEDYFGYDENEALEAWGQELFNLLWNTDLTWGGVFDYDDNSAMLVLFETVQDIGIYRGGFWGIDGEQEGEEVLGSMFQGSENIEYNPVLTEFWQNPSFLPQILNSDGAFNYQTYTYTQVGTWGNAGAGLSMLGIVLAAATYETTPIGWITTGVAAVSGTGGFVTLVDGITGADWLSLNASIYYPIMAPISSTTYDVFHLFSPEGLYE